MGWRQQLLTCTNTKLPHSLIVLWMRIQLLLIRCLFFFLFFYVSPKKIEYLKVINALIQRSLQYSGLWKHEFFFNKWWGGKFFQQAVFRLSIQFYTFHKQWRVWESFPWKSSFHILNAVKLLYIPVPTFLTSNLFGKLDKSVII